MCNNHILTLTVELINPAVPSVAVTPEAPHSVGALGVHTATIIHTTFINI